MVREQDDSTFIPQVTVNVIPKVGQEFQSLEDALNFYNDYARQAAFSTRVANNKKDKETGEDVWKMLSCSKEGKTDESWQNKHKNIVARSGERNRGHTRCGCKAKMTVEKSHDRNVWVVGYFIEQHNHAFSTPSLNDKKKALVQKFSEANIPTCQQVRLFEIDAGGPSFIGCVEKDLRNHKRDVEGCLVAREPKIIIFFKRYVNRKNSLVDFIMRFNRALVHQRHEELVANHTNLNEKLRMVTGFLMESQMASIYTKTIFLRFQKELQQSMLYICTLLSSTDASSKYTVKRFESGKIFHRERELTYYTSSDLISCSCRLFEFEGYACRHMLCWMKVQQIMILPEKYIIQRWTKEAKSTIIYEPTHNFVEGQSFASRRGALSHMSMDLVDNCSLTEVASNFLMADLHKLKSKVKDFDIGGNTNKRVNESGMHEVSKSVQDPNLVRAKGCRKRMKSSKEKVNKIKEGSLVARFVAYDLKL
ncbi:hypothetical protein C2S52_002698 [Perilla frutescens var. hirtella]|nr:hypothetical protein C2S52_002698 [Perilla frutescens var. hirtella]